ncbi:hypothetical protein U1R68_07565 [Pectobacterium colocasium]|uniref:hypothetical protein n=1 Tax=Pectobacterium TaxID=122277 RepID=UPI000CD13635|nr:MULTISPECIES: hypothetical protein [Pectobacterium]AYH25817.1 hypothetical protein C5E20_00715 [Pectobacterium parmentieri]MCH4997846.1 hypothetical protein [Pectobacterium carotovorum]POD89681.1 hypothetical protein BV925_21175 [Pectobacterium odoriferum]
MPISPIQKQLAELEKKVEILDSIIDVAKTSGGRITDDGKNLIYILRNAGMSKTDIAKLLDVSPAALTKYD